MIVSKKIILVGAGIVQLMLIFFYIYTQSIIIKSTYTFQETERIFQELQKKKKELTHNLLLEQDPQKLKAYATQELNMRKSRLPDIKKLPHNAHNE